MTNERPGPPDSVPTLTEEVSLPDPSRDAAEETPSEAPAASASTPAPMSEPVPVPVPLPVSAPAPATETLEPPAPSPALTDEQLTRQILADVQRQIDLVLEYRLREILTPILTRATDAVLRDARSELTRTLRDVVARSVAEEMRRQRPR